MSGAVPSKANDPTAAGPLTAAVRALTDQGLDELLPGVLRAADAALPVAPAEDRSVWALDSGTLDRATVDHIVAAAEESRATPWPSPTATMAARYHRDGDRGDWETTAFARIDRVARAVVAAAVTNSDEWIDEVADGLLMLLEQSTWCWPAHDVCIERGSILTDVTDPQIDLGAGEMVATLAWADQVLGAHLDSRFPGLRSRIRLEAGRRIFEPFVHNRQWWWLGHNGKVNNWNPWIHSNILVAALRLLDDPSDARHRSDIVALTVSGLDSYVASLPPDGSIDEGYDYWWAGPCRVLEALDLLRCATDGFVDLAPELPVLRNTLSYPYSMQLGGEWYYAVADGQARSSNIQPFHSLYRAAVSAGDRAAQDYAVARRVPGSTATERTGLGRLLMAITDGRWHRSQTSADPLPRDVHYPSGGVFVARPTAGSARGLTLAAKGGHNDEQHNHNDIGSVVVASDGVPVVVDPGRPRYSAATFGAHRYDLWPMQSSWHSVPEVDGVAQSAGRRYRATHTAAESTDRQASWQADISSAYPLEQLHFWIRRATLDRDSGIVSVDDRWAFAGDGESGDRNGTEPLPDGTRINYIVAGRVTQMGSGALVEPVERGTPMLMSWPAGLLTTSTEMTLNDPLLSRAWGDKLTRIEIHVGRERACSVTFQQVPNAGTGAAR